VASPAATPLMAATGPECTPLRRREPARTDGAARALQAHAVSYLSRYDALRPSLDRPRYQAH